MAPILSPDDPRVPRYWMYETSGVLKPVVLAYLRGEELSADDVALMRLYLRQWMASPLWQGGEELRALRESVETIQSREDLSKWLWAATHCDASATPARIRITPRPRSVIPRP